MPPEFVGDEEACALIGSPSPEPPELVKEAVYGCVASTRRMNARIGSALATW